jgi:hypothetical protein
MKNPPNTLHEPLLAALREFHPEQLPKDTWLFHGSRERSPHTDYANRQLKGSRKWFSQNLNYAVDYAFTDPGDYGKRLLWKCQLKEDVPCLKGRQSSLVKVSPWNDHFPWEFPNAFAAYAKSILDAPKFVGLLDHFDENIYWEILIAGEFHDLIKVVEVIELPENKDDAKTLVAKRA